MWTPANDLDADDRVGAQIAAAQQRRVIGGDGSISTARAEPWWRVVLLWVPFDERPGVLAFATAIARATVGAFVVTGLMGLAGQDYVSLGAGRFIASLGIAGFEELGRYSFARRAHRPGWAAIRFFVGINLVEVLGYWMSAASVEANLLARLPAVAIHVVMSIGVCLAIARPRHRAAILMCLVLAHGLFNTFAPAIAAGMNS